MPTFSRLLVLAVLAYGLYALVLTLLQRHLIFPGRELTPPPKPVGIAAGAEQLWISTSFGRVEARFIAGSRPGRQPVVILFHGNAELIDDLSPDYALFRQLGCGLLLVEYPGYGRSSGTPTERSLAEVALAAYDYLVLRPEVAPDRVMAFGSSLGAGPAIALAVQRPVRALLLAAPPASLRPFAHERLLPSVLLRDRFDNVDLITGYAGPTLVVHGRNDTIMPFVHGQRVAAAAPQGKLVVLEADHNDLLGAPGFWEAVSSFLQAERIVTAGECL